MVPKLWSGDSNVPDAGIIIIDEAFAALVKSCHSRDTARSTLGKPVATNLLRMPRVAAGELDEGNRLMFPPRIADVSLAGIMQDCQKRSGVKILPQHATRIGIVQRRKDI
jgi:hypothetical protein